MSAIPVLTPLKNAFQQSRAQNNIELILPELLAAQEQMPEQFASPYPQPMPRSGYRPAHAQLGPGFAVRTKYRFNVYRLWSGRSYDTTIFRNFSFEGTAAR